MTTFFDTSALIAAINDDESHHDWSVLQLRKSKLRGPVIITDIVYCDFSISLPTQAQVDKVVLELALERFPRDDAALFRAGKAFKAYRDANRGKPKDRVLPDFMIGAAAEMSNAPLVTANPRHFKQWFPTLAIIEP